MAPRCMHVDLHDAGLGYIAANTYRCIHFHLIFALSEVLDIVRMVGNPYEASGVLIELLCLYGDAF